MSSPSSPSPSPSPSPSSSSRAMVARARWSSHIARIARARGGGAHRAAASNASTSASRRRASASASATVDVDVWLYDPRGFIAAHASARDVVDACARVTTAEERAEMGATPERVVARAFARRVLASYDGVDAREISFELGARGKPRLVSSSSVASSAGTVSAQGSRVGGFSVSHCDGLVAVATTRDANAEIGCDVESEVRRLGSDVGKFSARWMSTSERRGLDAIGDDEEKARAFMKLWTLKEAYVKALGLGIAGRPFREFDVTWTRVARGDGDNGAMGCAIDGVKASTEGGMWRIDLSDDAAPEASRAWSMALLKPRLEHEHVLALCIPSAGESTRADIRVRWATPFDDVVNEDAVPALLGASSRFFA